MTTMKTTYINLFGGPGAGKSTLAAGLFHLMKKAHLDVELVQEYPKELAWDGRLEELSCQFKVTGEQMWRHQRLNGKVRFVITDSPVLLGSIYGRDRLTRTQVGAIFEWFLELDNYNIFLARSTSVPYNKTGRVHSYEEALDTDKLIKQYLLDMEVKHHDWDTEKDLYLLLEKIVKAATTQEGQSLTVGTCGLDDEIERSSSNNASRAIHFNSRREQHGGISSGLLEPVLLGDRVQYKYNWVSEEVQAPYPV